jgi:glycosyltransferase involved in cell wall biosynthesis
VIFFDITKSASAGHRSGLVRVNERLRQELGGAREVSWRSWDRAAGAADWFVTTELFSEAERPGLSAFLEGRRCRCAAIFHDAIPLRHPHITWPRSVARHPVYLKLLSRFDLVWTFSAATREDLLGYWRWLGVAAPRVNVLTPGADFNRLPRAAAPPEPGPASLLCVGILEPRKNQAFLLDVCAELWKEGREFDLEIVGRVNPHLGRPIREKIRGLRRRHPFLRARAAADDGELAGLYRSATASVLPTIAEGCGLTLLESLWMGAPCVCSDLPALRESAAGGGCLLAAPNDRSAWRAALLQVLAGGDVLRRLQAEAMGRALGTWAGAARQILADLGPAGVGPAL